MTAQRRPRRLLGGALIVALLLGVAAGCGDDGGDTDDASDTTEASEEMSADVDPALEEAVATTYADLVFDSYDDAVSGAVDMQTAIDTFVAAPTDEPLDAARQAWLDARDLYGPTEAFRFYDGPIDNPDDGPEGQINAWPMDEAYVDYVVDDPEAGIINDVEGYPEITADVLVSANEEGGETNISTGWHAIEFLLWGQDQSEDGPGDRPVTDYTDSPTAERRATYLQELTTLLISDLESVRDEWDPESGAYREDFLSDPHEAISKMMRGIGALSSGELAGERIAVAWETKDQEDEHSCFSDNTDADVRNNAAGIELVYLAGGAEDSLSALVASVSPELDQQIRDQLDETTAIIETYDAPFDQMILGDDEAPGRVALIDTVESLQAQGDLIALAATELGHEISLAI